MTHYYYGTTTGGDVRIWACARPADFPDRYVWSERHATLTDARREARRLAQSSGGIANMAPFSPPGPGPGTLAASDVEDLEAHCRGRYTT